MIGENIRKIRESLNLGVNEAARIASISGGYLSSLERGEKQNPSIEALRKIALALGVPVDEFFKSELDNMGERILKLREGKGLSQESLAKLAGISSQYIYDVEENKTILNSNILDSIADVLGTNSSFLMFGATEEELIHGKQKNTVPIEVKKQDDIYKTIPSQFINANEARAYVNSHQIFGAHGFNANKLDDNEILEFANELLKQMEMVSFKYKK